MAANAALQVACTAYVKMSADAANWCGGVYGYLDGTLAVTKKKTLVTAVKTKLHLTSECVETRWARKGNLLGTEERDKSRAKRDCCKYSAVATSGIRKQARFSPMASRMRSGSLCVASE